MRYFIEKFEETHNKEWPFGKFPAWEWYESTGTHIGTDFKIPIGTAIFAPIDGKMFKTFYHPYKGNVGIFIFTHKNTEWGLELCHLREQPSGVLFKEGDIIAYSGMTGEKVSGPHLHAVMHRHAHVTKHYGLLTSREAFLQLEKEGAIVDCFDWFCKNTRETPKSEPQPIVKDVPQKQEAPVNIKKEVVKPETKEVPMPAIPSGKNFWSLIFDFLKNWRKKD